jgi:hypothetical protein
VNRTKKALEEAIRAHGFDLRYVEYCEDAQTPGMLGMYRGVTSHERKTVKIATRARNKQGELPNEDDIIDVLEHELNHVVDPTWQCGSKSALSKPT